MKKRLNIPLFQQQNCLKTDKQNTKQHSKGTHNYSAPRHDFKEEGNVLVERI